MQNYTPLDVDYGYEIPKGVILGASVAFAVVISVLGALGYAVFSIRGDTQKLYTKVIGDDSKVTSGQVAGANTEAQNTEQAERSRKVIESSILVQQGETPSFVVVDNLDKISKEPFFKKVMIGDNLLIYPQSQLAVLFRPSIGKIVNMTMYDPQNTSQADSTPEQPQTNVTAPKDIPKPSAQAEGALDTTTVE